MPQCPKCGAALKDDYGMVTCPSCGAIVFVDMEGVAHIGTDAAPMEPAPVPEDFHESSSMAGDSASEFAPLNDYVTPIVSSAPVDEEPSVESGVDLSSRGDDDGSYLSSGDGSFHASPPGEELPSAGVETMTAETESSSSVVEASVSEFSMDSLLGYGEATQEASTSDLGPADDPLGISQYANSEISSAKDGPFLFRILLSGIDTKEIREALREAMEDSRFGWDSVQLMSRISKGNLVIDRVSPVKASILVNRIKRLPLGIRWEQYAITQMDNF